jgi:1-acyl-sn-glycerol-3-phosphate acyltransferase
MLSTISYRIITGIVSLCNWLRLVHWQVIGIENLPSRNSGMILVCNHLEWHDIPLIGWGITSHLSTVVVRQTRTPARLVVQLVGQTYAHHSC